MNKWTGLLRREWLEHRSALTWGPAVVLGLVLLVGLITLLANDHGEIAINIEQSYSGDRAPIEAPPGDLGLMEMIAAVTVDVAGSTDEELEQKLALVQTGLAQPFHWLFKLLVFLVLLSSLYDERKDASVLFWKSLPVSDTQTVASKLIFVLGVAPLMTIAAILIAQCLSLMLLTIYVEEGMGSRIWVASQFWQQPFQLVLTYFQLGIWMLPLATWTLLISSAVNRMPALYVFGLPWLLVMFETILLGTSYLAAAISTQLKGWLALSSVGGPGFFSGQLLGGVALAVLFFYVTVFFRRRNNEI